MRQFVELRQFVQLQLRQQLLTGGRTATGDGIRGNGAAALAAFSLLLCVPGPLGGTAAVQASYARVRDAVARRPAGGRGRRHR
ncbi:hypothetical protein ACFCYH_31085 [Streptomyces sp. NPDC056400]|uniref:hypothetical protein n=1 Tax=Streptomyces sp. NPDC056400 TaxID=3345808 RepID=UPI0035DD458E